MLEGFSAIWARADVKAFEQLLTEDADWVVRSGSYLKGRAAVVAHHANIMTGSFNGSSVVGSRSTCALSARTLPSRILPPS